MATTFAILSIDSSGVAVFQNGTGNADPLNVWLERGTPGVLVQGSWGEADANAQGWTYVGAQPGDVPFAQRLNATSPVKGPAVPAPVTPPPPPPPAPVSLVTEPTVSGTLQAGDKLTATPGTYLNEVSVTQQWLSGTPANQGVLAGQTVVGTGLTYTLGTADVGNQITLAETATGATGTTPLVDYVWGNTAVIAAVTPPPPPPPSGNPVAQFFTPGDAFNIPIPANPVLDPNNAAWVKLINGSAATSGADLATQSDAWPVFQALPTDPVITVAGAYQNATLHLPQGCKPQTPVGGDAHMFVISPDGTRVTEMGGVVLSGTWPNQTVKVGNGSSPCQFVISTAAGNTTTNIAGDGTVDGNPNRVGAPGSERGCAICCIAGLVMEAEFLAALAVENAGGEGLIPHALAATAPFTAGAPYVVAAKNTGAAGQPRLPALISDGGTSGGIPESARIQLNPATDISGLSASLRVIARTMQVHGWFLTDSTNTAIAFQGQAATVANTAWSAFEQGGSLAALPWADMRVLRSWNGQ